MMRSLFGIFAGMLWTSMLCWGAASKKWDAAAQSNEEDFICVHYLLEDPPQGTFGESIHELWEKRWQENRHLTFTIEQDGGQYFLTAIHLPHHAHTSVSIDVSESLSEKLGQLKTLDPNRAWSFQELMFILGKGTPSFWADKLISPEEKKNLVYIAGIIGHPEVVMHLIALPDLKSLWHPLPLNTQQFLLEHLDDTHAKLLLKDTLFAKEGENHFPQLWEGLAESRRQKLCLALLERTLWEIDENNSDRWQHPKLLQAVDAFLKDTQVHSDHSFLYTDPYSHFKSPLELYYMVRDDISEPLKTPILQKLLLRFPLLLSQERLARAQDPWSFDFWKAVYNNWP